MPALADTQACFLTRDIECSLVPPPHKDENTDAYHARLGVLYHLKQLDVAQIMQTK